MDLFLDWYWWVLIGIALFAFAAKIGFGLSPKGWKGVGVIAVIAGMVLANGAPLASIVTFADDAVDEDCITTGWLITPVELGTAGMETLDANWNSDKTVCTVPVNTADGTTGTVFTDNATRMSFTIEPLVKTGADNTQLATIYYKTDYAMTIGGDDLLYKSGTTYFANWSDASEARSDYEGSDSLAAGAQDNVSCDFVLNRNRGNTTGSAAYRFVTGGTGTSESFTITFWDNCGFSETFTVNVVNVGKTLA